MYEPDSLDEIIEQGVKPKITFAEVAFWLSAVSFFILSVLIVGISLAVYW